jgi:hypothetical protein
VNNIDIDQQLKKIFPNNYGFLKQKIDLSKSKVTAKKDKELEDYFKEHTYNLPLNIHYIKSESISPFTIPILIDDNISSKEFNLTKLSTFLPIFGDLYKILIANRLLIQVNINGELDSSNKIIFTYNNKFNSLMIQAWQPSSYLKLFNKEDVRLRFAVMLHEIGHWVNVREYFLVDLFNILRFIIFVALVSLAVAGGGLLIGLPLALVSLTILFISHYITSLNESRCDMFVKKLGYGEYLAESLRILGNKFTNSNLPKIENIKEEYNGFSSKFNDIINRLIIGYPSIYSRIKKLMESDNLLLNDTLILEEVKDIDPTVMNKLLLSLTDTVYSFGNSLDKKIRLD